jgi:hypothetical protein
MIKLLESRKFKLPQVLLVTDKEDLKTLSIGVPFIFGDESIEPYLIRLLEYEVLYTSALKTGYPFDFRKILLENGYDDITNFDWHETVYMDYTTEKVLEGDVEDSRTIDDKSGNTFKKFVKDSSCYVDIGKIKALNIFPTWLNTIEEAIKTNIHNFAVFNSNMYNKKLEGMYGGIELTSPKRNLIIIDISGSIPRAVSTTTLTLAKNLSETFYADILITGTISTLYLYEEVYKLNIDTIYEINGMDNDDIHFRKLIFGNKKQYQTIIAFGDNHTHLGDWSGAGTISEKYCLEKNNWEVEKIISFHTTSNKELAGYCRGFDCKNIINIDNWVSYLK